MIDDFLIDPSWWPHLQDVLKHMILPSLTLGLVLYGEYTLIVRSAMLETLGEDYILTARAKGLKPWAIVRKHALRNALLPITTLIALSLGYIVARRDPRRDGLLLARASAAPSTTRSWQRDYPMLQGAFLVLTVSVVLLQPGRRPPLLQARPEDHRVSVARPRAGCR